MKLTGPQIVDALAALQHGVANAAWEGIGDVSWAQLSPTQRAAQLEQARMHAERSAAELVACGVDPKLNQQYLARFNLAVIEQAEAAEAPLRERNLQVLRGQRSIRGFEMALNDLLSQVGHFSGPQRRAVDRRLAAKGLPPLRELSAKLQRKLDAILRRGKIRNEDEYYIVKEIICDLESEVSDAGRQAFERMADEFEHGAGSKQKP